MCVRPAVLVVVRGGGPNSCCCTACIVASAKLCACDLGDVKAGALIRLGKGLMVLACGLRIEFVSRYPPHGISFNTRPVGTLSLCPLKPGRGGGVVACLDLFSGRSEV